MNFSDLTPEEFEGINEARFEWAVVESILARFGDAATDMKKTLRRRAQTAGGPDAYPTFYDFYTEFDHVAPPIYLFVRRFAKIAQAMPLYAIIERLEKTPPYKEWQELSDEVPHGWRDPYGVAFFWPYLKQGVTKQGEALVLHNHSTMGCNTRGFIAKYIAEDGTQVFLQPLNRMLDQWASFGYFDR